MFGEVASASSWFGMAPPSIYESGLSFFSASGAIHLLPLLMCTLAFNLERPNWLRSLLCITGCAVLYCTLARAGWLAFFLAMLVLGLRVRRQPIQVRDLVSHAALAMVAAFLHMVYGQPDTDRCL